MWLCYFLLGTIWARDIYNLEMQFVLLFSFFLLLLNLLQQLYKIRSQLIHVHIDLGKIMHLLFIDLLMFQQQYCRVHCII